MTLPAPFPIPPLLSSMAEAMDEIRMMLLRYEEAMVDAPRDADKRRAAQDFDLAVQILQDIEHVATLLAQELPPDLMAQNALPLAGVRLDRSRRRFVAATKGSRAPSALPTGEARGKIDLFLPDAAAPRLDRDP